MKTLTLSTKKTCLLCIEQEVAKLLSLCMDLGLELETRRDVYNLIQISGLSSIYEDSSFIENVIDRFLETI